jgi:polyphosphate glucokinase
VKQGGASAVLGLDVGGSSVKAGLVDVLAGRLLQPPESVPTPQPSAPQALMPVLRGLVERLAPQQERIAVAFPSVVKGGRTLTAANIDRSWIGADAEGLATAALGRAVRFLNDADAAGLAEMRWGAGKGLMGTVIMLTFGTGIGTALFTDGRLLPNSELGHLEVHGVDAETLASARARTREKLDFPTWSKRVNDYLDAMFSLFWPDVFILGGAVSERFAEFAPLLRSQAKLRPAHFVGHAGVIGAAWAAIGAEL